MSDFSTYQIDKINLNIDSLNSFLKNNRAALANFTSQILQLCYPKN